MRKRETWKKSKSSMNWWGKGMDKQRVCGFDFLRVVSIFFVVVIHITSVGLRLCDSMTGTWIVNALINSISRWAVPVFFMVSGALFLDPRRELSIKKLYTKNISRIAICIIAWGFVYSLLDQYLYGTLSAKSILIAVYGIITGNTGYHLWFLYTLIMLYIATPLFRLITCHASKRQLEYALVVWIIFSLIAGQINSFAAEFGFDEVLSLYVPFVITGYGGYFLLGHYLTTYPLKGAAKRRCYILAILSACVICGGKWILPMTFKIETAAVEAPLGLFSCLVAGAVFTVSQNISISDTGTRVLSFLGQRTFGIYLTHVFFISLLYHIWHVKPDYCQPVLAIFVSSVGVFAASLFVSWIMSKIPLLRKFV